MSAYVNFYLRVNDKFAPIIEQRVNKETVDTLF